MNIDPYKLVQKYTSVVSQPRALLATHRRKPSAFADKFSLAKIELDTVPDNGIIRLPHSPWDSVNLIFEKDGISCRLGEENHACPFGYLPETLQKCIRASLHGTIFF